MRAPELIAKARRLWDAYYERPTKRNLHAFRRHLSAMERSRAKSVKDELRRARRAYNKELRANPSWWPGEESPSEGEVGFSPEELRTIWREKRRVKSEMAAFEREEEREREREREQREKGAEQELERSAKRLEREAGRERKRLEREAERERKRLEREEERERKRLEREEERERKRLERELGKEGARRWAIDQEEYEAFQRERESGEHERRIEQDRRWEEEMEQERRMSVQERRAAREATASRIQSMVRSQISRRGRKGNPRHRNPLAGQRLDIRAALDILNLGRDPTEAEVEASAQDKKLIYGGMAPLMGPSRTRPKGAADLQYLALVNEAEEVVVDWIARGRPEYPLGDWVPIRDRPAHTPPSDRDRLFASLGLEWSEDVSEEDVEEAVRRDRMRIMASAKDAEAQVEAIVALSFAQDNANSYIRARDRGAELQSVVAEATEERLLAPYRDPRGRLLRKTHKSLKKLGYVTGAQPKRMTEELSQALSAFQSDQGLEPHGVLTPQTEDALVAAAGETSLEALRRSKKRARGR